MLTRFFKTSRFYVVVLLWMMGLFSVFQGNRVDAAKEQQVGPQELGTWSDVTSPVNNYFLRAVSIVSPNAAWAVGYKTATNGNPNGGIILFWDGNSWAIQTSTFVSLWDVTMLSSTDGWAVGQTGSTLLGEAAILHWDGVTWSTVTIPAGCQRLTSVSMASAATGWAVGIDCIMKYSGSWSERTYLSSTSFLDAVEAISPTDVWAVGQTEYGYLFAHYDGNNWAMNEIFALGDRFRSLSAISSSNIWAAGENQGKIIRWNGEAWNLDSPIEGALYGIKMKSDADGWVVGNVISHWDGITWTQVAGIYADRYYFGIDMKDYYGWAVGSDGRIKRYLEEIPFHYVYLPIIRR
ncbi:MAG TPA: hypothetical protein PK530_20885 [Anaerolineales bacterium]|nr:hypothetical protein [Anaerolineales bacterium]